ncbi:MAG: MFS transporter [Verrucomicrobiales bacterium]|nr:MFS transporter [Verrucomicrobiales bacterium]
MSSGGRFWAPKFPFDPARWPFFYGWVMVLAGTVGVVFSIPGQTMGVSVFTDVLIEELGLTRVELSSAYMVGTVGSGLTLPYLGRLFDRFGARKMVVGSALVTGVVLFYLSGSAWITEMVGGWLPDGMRVWVALGVITLGFYLVRASAQGVLTMTSRNAVGKWFDYHRGTALAASGVFTAFAFSAAPKGLDWMIGSYGWQGAWMVLGGLTLTVMVGVGWLFFRDNPEECGLEMDGPARGERKREVHADAVAHRSYPRGEALRTWAFWAFNLSFVFYAMFGTAFTFHVVSIGELAGREKDVVIGYFMPMAGVSVVSNLLVGWASARTRLKYLLAGMNLGALLGVLGVLYLGTGWGALLYVVGNGACGGAFSALCGIVGPRFFGRKWLGAISGVGMSSMVIASGVGPFLFGASLEWAGSYSTVLWVCGAVPAVLVLASFWADNPQRARG